MPALPSTAADGVEDVQFDTRIDPGLKAFQPFNIVRPGKYVHMRSDLALFVQDAVAKRRMNFPKRIKRLADIRKFSYDRYFKITVRKGLQMSAKENSY